MKKQAKKAIGILDEVKYGYDHYSWIFWIGSLGVIMGNYLGNCKDDADLKPSNRVCPSRKEPHHIQWWEDVS